MPQPSELGANLRPDGYFDKDAGDVIETHAWMCVRTISGILFFFSALENIFHCP